MSYEISRTLAIGSVIALVLNACTAVRPTAPSVTAASVANDGGAIIVGKATGPAGIGGGNTSALISGSGLIGNSGAGLIGNSGAGLIGNSGAGFRSVGRDWAQASYGIQAYSEEPIKNALLYLTDLDDHFFSFDNGTIVSASTDASGDFVFPAHVKVDTQTVVNVILPGNRREVGFSLPKAGKNVVTISVPSTYVTEFLRLHAKRDGKAMSAYQGGLSALPDLTERTKQTLAAGVLQFDPGATGSLNMGNIEGVLDRQYALAIGANQNGLGDAWASFLGYRVHSIETVLGTGVTGNGTSGPATTVPLNIPQALALASDGTLYLAEEKSNHVRVMRPDGTTAILAGSASGLSGSSGDGGKATDALLNEPRSLALAPDGNLYVGDGGKDIRVVALTSTASPWVSGAWQVGNIYQVLGASGVTKGDGPFATAKIESARGIVFDAAGNLYFSEKGTSLVRVLTPPNAATRTLLGVSCPAGYVTTLAGSSSGPGFAGDGGSALAAQFSGVENLTFDRSGNLLVADRLNNRIRCIAGSDGTFYQQSMKLGQVYTIAGSGAQGGAGDGGPATAAALNLPYDVQVDAKGRLFLSQKGMGGIRYIDPNGTIYTLGGNGTDDQDNDAVLVKLNEPLNIALEPSGNLLISESRGARVRRMYLQFGL